MTVLHHAHLRKRRARAGLEPFPARTSWKRFLDKIIYVAGVAGPVMALPQIYKVFSEQDATGLSPFSWAAWTLLNIPWLLYAFAHHERPIIVTNSLWFLCNGAIFLGALLYGSTP